MMDNFTWQTPLERTTHVRLLRHSDGIYLWDRRDITREFKDGNVVESVIVDAQGIVRPDQLDAVKSGNTKNLKVFDLTNGEHPSMKYTPWLISDRGLELIRNEGNPFIHAKVMDQLRKNGDLKFTNDWSFIDHIASSKSPKDFEHGTGFQRHNLFFATTNDYSIVDINGIPVPEAHKFDTDDGFTDRNFDLDQLLEHLSRNPEVEITPDRYGSVKRIVPNYDDAPSEPVYGIAFTWRPTEESWRGLLKTMTEAGEDVRFKRMKGWELASTRDVFGVQDSDFRIKETEQSPSF